MKKKKTVVVVVIALIILGALGIWGFHKCCIRMEALDKIGSNENELDVIDKDNNKPNYENYEAYLDELFPTDGTLYKLKHNDVFFYSDVKCTKRIKNVKLISIASASHDTVSLFCNDQLIYAYRMSNKKICYSKQKITHRDCMKCN